MNVNTVRNGQRSEPSEKPQAFVLMPFDEELDWAYDRLISPAFEDGGYVVVRADDIDSQQNILKDIVTAIVESDLIVADLTGANPNVYYELGLAHALGKQVILLSQDVSAAPFDLRSYRIVEYGDRFDRFERARERLTELAHGVSREEVTFGNPVSDFVPRSVAATPAALAVEERKSDKGGGEERREISRDDDDEDDDEPGVLDLMVATEQGFADQKQWLEEGAGQIATLGRHASNTTPIIAKLRAANDLQGLRIVFRKASAFYDARTAELHDINDKLRASWERTSDALDKRFRHSMTDRNTQAALLRPVREMCIQAAEAKASMAGLTHSVDGLPNVDRMFTRAKRRLVRELEVLVAYIDDVASFEGRLTGMLGEEAEYARPDVVDGSFGGHSSGGKLNGSGEGGGRA